MDKMHLFIFGPSCSGKSTLALALKNSLGEDWRSIDRDDLIEQNICTEDKANQTIDGRIASLKANTIIDAQIPWRDKKEGEFYFVVLPPLAVLLGRDSNRTQRLKRTEKRAHYARLYVEETYQKIASLAPEIFDARFDSSLQTIEQELRIIYYLTSLSS